MAEENQQPETEETVVEETVVEETTVPEINAEAEVEEEPTPEEPIAETEEIVIGGTEEQTVDENAIPAEKTEEVTIDGAETAKPVYKSEVVPVTLLSDRERMDGKVVKWIPNKGYGFIRVDEDATEIFCHRNDLKTERQDLNIGENVSFVKEIRDGKPRALDVTGDGTGTKAKPRSGGRGGRSRGRGRGGGRGSGGWGMYGQQFNPYGGYGMYGGGQPYGGQQWGGYSQMGRGGW